MENYFFFKQKTFIHQNQKKIKIRLMNRAILKSISKSSYDYFPTKCYNVICVNKLGGETRSVTYR